MEIDTIAALQLLSVWFISIASQLNKLKRTPKQRFARELIVLFDILGLAERDLEKIISSLNDFSNETTTEMKVRFIHKAGELLEEFSQTCGSFTIWVDKHKELSNALDMLSPMAETILSELDELDIHYTKGIASYININLNQVIHTLRENLQAVRSPIPQGFPTPEFVIETIDLFSRMLANVKKAKKLVRQFASLSLTVEDFF